MDRHGERLPQDAIEERADAMPDSPRMVLEFHHQGKSILAQDAVNKRMNSVRQRPRVVEPEPIARGSTDAAGPVRAW